MSNSLYHEEAQVLPLSNSPQKPQSHHINELKLSPSSSLEKVALRARLAPAFFRCWVPSSQHPHLPHPGWTQEMGTHTHAHHLPFSLTIQGIQQDYLSQTKRTKTSTILRLTSLKWGFQSWPVHRGSAAYPEVKPGQRFGLQSLHWAPQGSVAQTSHLHNQKVPSSHYKQCNENLQGFRFIYIYNCVCM